MKRSIARIWCLFCLVTLGACRPQGETQTFNSNRPLSDAAKSLSQKYGYLISYEDPRRDCACDMVDEMGWQMKTGDYLAPERLIVPRPRQLHVPLSADAGPAAVARVIVSAAQTDLPEYRFRVIDSGKWAHIVPEGARDASGKFTTSPSPLDARISLPATPRTSIGLIMDFCKAVNKSSGVKVICDTMMLEGIESDDGPTKYTVGANNEVARDVLRRAIDTIFEEVGGGMIWVMNYDSAPGDYYLNLVPVPRTQN